MDNVRFIAENYDVFEKAVRKEKGTEKPRQAYVIQYLVDVEGWKKEDVVLACKTFWHDIQAVRPCYNTQRFNDMLDVVKTSVEGLKIVSEVDHDIVIRGLKSVGLVLTKVLQEFEEDKKKMEEHYED